ncbi:BZ3500_MvSof-1268-A1-R1_Chr7-1g09295 [Microbotryum saponariae]|uniref:BZ3500_MvSof-1268-A1-R1_Chr7-1g09295 protein n=1 Tax=Microbotryum saponariae TaxID=289078 RepID=A0A2X0LBU9_9BASI|nr:BZ3501_MvSof-1269-A2-R1_Chr7-1g09000 [Microbotryum saponariae]SDA03179.1 BZ3500_MvSof-1268-A1-R1_Chr7-1g09295 [Microbotryum saponariae]
MAPASKTPPTTQDVYLDCECDAALDKITAAIAKAKRVVVAVGAGISTSAGVPDFRTKTSGLYARAGNAVGGDDHQGDARARRAATGTAASPTKTASKATTKRAESNSLKGPAMFTSSVYTAVSTRTAHWQFMTRLKRSVDHIASASIPPQLTSSSTALPSSPSRSTRASAEKREKGVTKTHAFFDTLHRRGQLERVYTQNIDGFELTSGQLEEVGIEGIRVQADHVDYSERSLVPKAKGKAKAKEWTGDVVQLHGSLGRVKCSSCAWVGEWDERHSKAFEKGMSVDCPACVSQAELRVCCGKRALVLRSFVRPSIVLYGERSPAEQSIGSIITYDLSRKPDLLIVMGTTLKISGFKRLVADMSREVRKNGGLAIFVNREKNGAAMWKKVFDYQVIGSTDDFVDRLLKRWKQTRPADWQKQATLNDTFTVTKPSQVVVSKPVQPVLPMTPSASSTRTPLRDPNFSLVVPGPGTPPPSPLKRRSSCSDRTNLPSMDKLPETPSKRRSPRSPRADQEQEPGASFDFDYDYDHLDQLSKTRYPRMDQISDPPSTPFRMPVIFVPKSPPTPTRKVLPRSPRRAVAR